MGRGNFISSDKCRKIYTPPRHHGNTHTAHASTCDDVTTLSREEKLTLYETYVTTGDFAKDFENLCLYLDIGVQVVVR